MADSNDVFLGGPMQLPSDPGHIDSPKPKKSLLKNKKLLVPLCLTLFAILGLAGWKFMGSQADRSQAPSSETATSQTPQSTTDDTPATAETKTFKGDHPRVEFTYPADWIVTEADNGVKVESPEFTYQTSNLGSVTGHFRVYIRQGARDTDSKYIGRGVAIGPSEKLAYSAPVTGQRPETNLSSFGLDSPDFFAFFLIAGNFTLQKDDSLGPNYGKEPETYIVVGGYSAKDLSEDLQTNAVPLQTYNKTNAYNQAIEIVKSLKLL